MNILLIEDDGHLGELISSSLRRMSHKVAYHSDPKEALAEFEEGSFEIVISDIRLPGISGIELVTEIKKRNFETQVIIITGYGSTDNAIAALKAGASDFLVKPFDLNELSAAVEKSADYRKLLHENGIFKERIKHNDDEYFHYLGTDSIIGDSAEVTIVTDLIGKAADASDSSVLITGESGTGKELAASLIHRESLRAEGPFMTVNCSGFSPSLIESELFGHVKGAFTGAESEKKGVIELAQNGTLFLDEIGDMPLNVQARFLRVIEEKHIRRVGGQVSIPVDFRLICATNRDLPELVQRGEFRQDLYFRINILSIHMPPLRGRKKDIRLLTDHFIHLISRKLRKNITALSPEVYSLLENYPFPGNVRELKNMIEQAIILCDDAHLKGKYFPSSLLNSDPAASGLMSGEYTNSERDLLLNVLNRNKWHLKKTAEDLKLGYDALRYRMRKYNLHK